MSTKYRPLSPIFVSNLIDGRMKNVRVHKCPHGPFETCLTDGRNFLWVYFDAKGQITSFSRYHRNGAPQGILTAIAEAFDVEIASEHEPGFWGFETEAEWDACWQALADQQEHKLCGEIAKFVRGEPNGIEPGTNAMTTAEICKKMRASNPDLFWLWANGGVDKGS